MSDARPAEPQPALLLLPGHLCDARMWRRQVGALAAFADVRVPSLGPSDSIAGLAESVLADAPARFALCGFSLGGYVAFEIMRRAPERVTRLALIDTTAQADSAERRQAREVGIAAVERGKIGLVVEAFVQAVSGPVLRRNASLAAELRAMMRSPDEATYIAQQYAMIERPDSRPDLARISCPTLIAWGSEDRTTPPSSHREMAAGIAGAMAVEIEDAGHMSPMEQPEVITTLLRHWLQRPELHPPGR